MRPKIRQRACRLEVNPTTAGELPLPHEHDETPEQRSDARTSPQPAVAQAARDLRDGQVDTDNYTRAHEITRCPARRWKRAS